jgi:peptidoglycan/xylan/chitin deacetylase (PgdA/CDA1 family)
MRQVTLRFDDALASHWTEAQPRLTKYGFPGVLAIPTNHVDKPGHLTLAQLNMLQHFGWDVCSHSMTHPHMTGLTSEKMDIELEGSKEWLIKHGFRKGARFFITPYGESNPQVDEEIAKYYVPADKGLHCTIKKGMSAEVIHDWIDHTTAHSTLIFHDFTSTPSSEWQYPPIEFQKILDHIHNENLRVVTFSDRIGDMGK